MNDHTGNAGSDVTMDSGITPLVICHRSILPAHRRHIAAGIANAITRERMRLSRRAFTIGFGREFRACRHGGKRTFLPIVAK